MEEAMEKARERREIKNLERDRTRRERAQAERERLGREIERAKREKEQGRAGTPGYGLLPANKVERDRILAQSKKWLQDRVGENCGNCKKPTMFVISQGGTGGACGASISVTNIYLHVFGDLRRRRFLKPKIVDTCAT